MQILILNGSPRKKGNTARLCEHLQTRLIEKNASVRLIRLAGKKIHPCVGCGNCEKTGNCVFKDDMAEVYSLIREADRIILASPIYFYALTAQTKLCVDRCQALWSRKYVLKRPISDKPDRRGYLISIAATRGEKIFTGAILCARYAFDAMDATYSGELLFPGVDQPGAIESVPEYYRKGDQFIRSLLEK